MCPCTVSHDPGLRPLAPRRSASTSKSLPPLPPFPPFRGRSPYTSTNATRVSVTAPTRRTRAAARGPRPAISPDGTARRARWPAPRPWETRRRNPPRPDPSPARRPPDGSCARDRGSSCRPPPPPRRTRAPARHGPAPPPESRRRAPSPRAGERRARNSRRPAAPHGRPRARRRDRRSARPRRPLHGARAARCACSTRRSPPPRSLQRSLGGRHVRDARVRARGLAQGARRGLENGLDTVVRVLAAQQVQVQRQSRVRRERAEELGGERGIVVPQPLGRRWLRVVGDVGPAADVHDDPGEGIVQRHRRLAVTADAAPLAQRLGQRLAQHDPHVLHGVVLVHVEVAPRGDLEVEERVARQRLEHVVEEADARLDLRPAGAIETHPHPHFGLLGLARHLPGAAHPRISASARATAVTSSSVPAVIRRHPSSPGPPVETSRTRIPYCCTSRVNTSLAGRGSQRISTKFAAEGKARSPPIAHSFWYRRSRLCRTSSVRRARTSPASSAATAAASVTRFTL